jgi:hypothetical protein
MFHGRMAAVQQARTIVYSPPVHVPKLADQLSAAMELRAGGLRSKSYSGTAPTALRQGLKVVEAVQARSSDSGALRPTPPPSGASFSGGCGGAGGAGPLALRRAALGQLPAGRGRGSGSGSGVGRSPQEGGQDGGSRSASPAGSMPCMSRARSLKPGQVSQGQTGGGVAALLVAGHGSAGGTGAGAAPAPPNRTAPALPKPPPVSWWDDRTTVVRSDPADQVRGLWGGRWGGGCGGSSLPGPRLCPAHPCSTTAPAPPLPRRTRG